MKALETVAGPASIRDALWTRPHPARLLLGAVPGTQTNATLIAGYGFLMTRSAGAGPHSSGATPCSGSSSFWFLVEDRAELATHSGLDRHPRQVTGPRAADPPAPPAG